MANQPHNRIYSHFGFVIWGDIANLTMYRRYDGRLVIFKKTWPDKPPSAKQLADRAQFKAAATAWRALAAAQRAQWTLAAHRGCMPATGYNLFMHWQRKGDEAAIQTIERQTHTTLLP